MDALERLENAHENRINAGVENENDPRIMSKKSTDTMIRIEESLGMTPDNENDLELQRLLDQLRKVDNDIIELLELQSKADKTAKLKEKKEQLLSGLKEDISELNVKVTKLRKEIDTMILNVEGLDTDKSSSEKKIFAQETLLKQLEIEIRDLKQRLKELDGLSIEGFTDAEILDLREILDKINREIESLKKKQRKQDEYYSIRKSELLEKEKYIEELRRQLRDMADVIPEPKDLPKNIYIDAVDDVDIMMLEYMKKWNCNVPITRMGNGYYLFGTRKIYAKIMNGKLVIRVGGGYMNITEFLDQYSEVEMNKIERLMEKEGVSRYEDIKVVRQHLGPVWEERDKNAKKRQKSQGKEPMFRKI